MSKLIRYALLLLIFILLADWTVACIKEEDYKIPSFEISDPEVKLNFSIAEVLAMLEEEPVQIHSQIPRYLEAYVVSDDLSRNFYKTLVIQDKPENPTAGISIFTQATDMYTHFEPGRKVFLRVDGLYIGSVFGLPSLLGKDAERISVEDLEHRLLRTNTKVRIVPKLLTINQLSEAYLNTLIKLEGLEFLSEHKGLSYGDIHSNSGVNRILQDCNRRTIAMYNNGLADFKAELLPTGKGSVSAVLSAFYNTRQLLIRDTNDVLLNAERCNEDEFVEWQIPFKEGFSNHEAGIGVYVSLPGWTNTNNAGRNRRFEVREFNGNKYAQISAFGSKEKVLEAWLVTPSILLDASKVVLSFDTKDSYFDNLALKLYITTDFTGDPLTTEWINITDKAIISIGHAFWETEFTNSGEIDLSSYTGMKVAIGFRYSGADPGITTSYQIDNIQLYAVEE